MLDNPIFSVLFFARVGYSFIMLAASFFRKKLFQFLKLFTSKMFFA